MISGVLRWKTDYCSTVQHRIYLKWRLAQISAFLRVILLYAQSPTPLLPDLTKAMDKRDSRYSFEDHYRDNMFCESTCLPREISMRHARGMHAAQTCTPRKDPQVSWAYWLWLVTKFPPLKGAWIFNVRLLIEGSSHTPLGLPCLDFWASWGNMSTGILLDTLEALLD